MTMIFLGGKGGKMFTHGAGDGCVIVYVDRQTVVSGRTTGYRGDPMGMESGSEEQTGAKNDGHQSAEDPGNDMKTAAHHDLTI